MELPEGAPAPRLCHLIKWPDFDGYGFNLHSEKSKSNCQYVGKVDHSSPAQTAGLQEGDRIVEVNGVNISTENHRQVVERIKAIPQETKLLVIDHDGELWYKSRDLIIRGTQSNVIQLKTPVPRPTTNGSNGHQGEESPIKPTSEATPNSPPSNFHDLSISGEKDERINSTPVRESCESPSKVEVNHQTNGHSQEMEQIATNGNQDDSFKANGTHDEIEVVVSKSPSKLASSPSPADTVMTNGTTKSSCQDTVMTNGTTKSSRQESGEEVNKTATDSINNNNIEEEEKSRKKIPLQQESGLSNEAASTSSTRSSTCGSPDHHILERHKLVSDSSAAASKMHHQPSNGSLRQNEDVNMRPLSKNESNGVKHVGGGSRGSSESTGSVPASPTSMKSSGSNSTSNEPTSVANLSTGSSSAIMSSMNGRPSSEADMLQLNLNMSVSEMRQMLARKKKQDPKKAQIDLKQKYEIIQQM